MAVATVIPTPTVTRNQDIIYQTGSSKLVINGTNFREKVHPPSPVPPSHEAPPFLATLHHHYPWCHH